VDHVVWSMHRLESLDGAVHFIGRNGGLRVEQLVVTQVQAVAEREGFPLPPLNQTADISNFIGGIRASSTSRGYTKGLHRGKCPNA
jgi:hypothetical protein